jgi:hypothetical protein
VPRLLAARRVARMFAASSSPVSPKWPVALSTSPRDGSFLTRPGRDGVLSSFPARRVPRPSFGPVPTSRNADASTSRVSHGAAFLVRTLCGLPQHSSRSGPGTLGPCSQRGHDPAVPRAPTGSPSRRRPAPFRPSTACAWALSVPFPWSGSRQLRPRRVNENARRRVRLGDSPLWTWTGESSAAAD